MGPSSYFTIVGMFDGCDPEIEAEWQDEWGETLEFDTRELAEEHVQSLHLPKDYEYTIKEWVPVAICELSKN